MTAQEAKKKRRNRRNFEVYYGEPVPNSNTIEWKITGEDGGVTGGPSSGESLSYTAGRRIFMPTLGARIFFLYPSRTTHSEHEQARQFSSLLETSASLKKANGRVVLGIEPETPECETSAMPTRQRERA